MPHPTEQSILLNERRTARAWRRDRRRTRAVALRALKAAGHDVPETIQRLRDAALSPGQNTAFVLRRMQAGDMLKRIYRDRNCAEPARTRSRPG